MLCLDYADVKRAEIAETFLTHAYQDDDEFDDVTQSIYEAIVDGHVSYDVTTRLISQTEAGKEYLRSIRN